MVERYYPETHPRFDAVGGPERLGTPVYGDIRVEMPFSEDSFGNLLTRNTQNELDIGSQYQFSPERLRLFKDGTRQFVQYDSPITGFTDGEKTWDLAPAQGESMHIETAESASYVVGYELAATAAFQLSRSLQTGDEIKVGPRGSDNGWYIEQRGADHTDTQVDIKQLDGGTETTLAADVELPKPTTDATRIQTIYNWYGIGSQYWNQAYADDGQQQNQFVTETAEDGVFSGETGNLNVWQEVTRGASTDTLTMHCGSMSLITHGDTANLTRSKPQFVEVDLPGTNDTWLPVYALRLDPDKPRINARVESIEIINYANNATVELVAASFDNDKTNIPDGDFIIPEYHHDQNSVIQEATAGADSVYNVADDGGTVGTLGANDKFGGYTIASAIIDSGGNTLAESPTNAARTEIKKSVLGSDHLVFMARTPNAGGVLTFVWNVIQDW